MVKVIFPLFGVLFVVGSIFSMIKGAGAADTYKTREAAYQARREAIRRELDRMK